MKHAGLTDDELAEISTRLPTVERDIKRVLDSSALDIIEWDKSPSLIVKETPSDTDLRKRQSAGISFWLTRLVLAEHLKIDPEAKLSAHAARAWGAVWLDIGQAVGITLQGAQQRYRLRP
jgi:hypothetical protein